MTSKEYESFNAFIYELLYNRMTLDDYDFILSRLGCENHNNRFKTICHNSDIVNAKYNLAFISETRTFYCHSGCQCAYSILSLIKKRREILGEPSSTYQCLKWLCAELGIEFNFNNNTDEINTHIYKWQNYLNKYTHKTEDNVELNKINKNILNNFEQLYPLDWLEYGINEETLDKYNIMWYKYKNQIVIPCYKDNGDLVGIRIRNTNPNIEVKYKPLQMLDGTEYNFPTGELFYGENFNLVNVQRLKSVILVESEKTVMKFDSWYGADKNICLGLFGSNLTKSKLKKLLEAGCTKFYIALDSDFTTLDSEEYFNFEKKVIKIYNMIKPYSNEIYVVYNNLGFDNCYKFSITDYTKEQFEQLWNSKERIDL